MPASILSSRRVSPLPLSGAVAQPSCIDHEVKM
eukprot:CAMPEP_0115246590 /NCGR_PEP_ID=MMETSP0270-20121206/41107_1 /TAXON_ID=71861 /ORGANISM="Scrippsiella trochoidea, Strain CCMP3099" /LENGTH=32 /DNA_ID= /DNA_START= /DNA_END= /DNA_ORIENTATION=